MTNKGPNVCLVKKENKPSKFLFYIPFNSQGNIEADPQLLAALMPVLNLGGEAIVFACKLLNVCCFAM